VSKIYAIAHHSPIDIQSSIPLGVSVTTNVNDNADVLFCRQLTKGHEKFKYIFLFSSNHPDGTNPLDETRGEIRSITQKVVDQIFNSILKEVEKNG
jgi:hypothetical protein